MALYAAVILAAYFLAPSSRPMTVAIGIASILATVKVVRWEARSRVRRLQVDDPHALETHFVELSPEGVRTWCAHVDARYTWGDFAKVLENPEFYLFVRRSGSGAAIPKRLVTADLNSELRHRIRDWAADHGENLTKENGQPPIPAM